VDNFEFASSKLSILRSVSNRLLQKLAARLKYAKTRSTEQPCTLVHEDSSNESTKYFHFAVEFLMKSNHLKWIYRAYVMQQNVTQTLNKNLELAQVTLYIKNQTGHDFSLYKPSTLLRRIQKRLDLLHINTLAQYICYLQQYPAEINILFNELLINVTSFFRDNAAFEQLKHSLLTKILINPINNECIRVWVPGCASGEEAYSIAIILQECMSILNTQFKVKIFATDLDAEAIKTARMGVFPVNIEKNVSPERLQRFFIKKGNTYKVIKKVRSTVNFAIQNLIEDPPFIKLHLISCRNLFIYFQLHLQQKILPLFHFSLNTNGLLFLGSSESIKNSFDLFNTVDKKMSIYESKSLVVNLSSLIDRSHMKQLSKNKGVSSLPISSKKQELKCIKEKLYSTIEGLEISNEELKSSNEELLSTNEELCALNDELTTLNNDFECQINQLVSTNEDVKQLVDVIGYATIFLDTNLCIKQFTSKTMQIINLIPSDVGRPLSHIVSNLHYEQLVDDARNVLITYESLVTEAIDKKGCWYEVRMEPHLAVTNIVDGVIISFICKNELKIIETKAKKLERDLMRFESLSLFLLIFSNFEGTSSQRREVSPDVCHIN
jgi:two-component system CheB/CheR fusion protein